MHPLIRIGSFTLYSYGLTLVIAVLVGVLVGFTRARRFGLPPDRVRDVMLYSLLAGLLGARLHGFLLSWNPQLDLVPQLFRAYTSGGTVQGGLIAAILVAVLYMRRHGLSVWLLGDAAVPGMLLAQAVGRTGCFMAGCCYGKPTDLPWGVTFHNPAAALLAGTPLGVPLHPTQLYEAGADLGIALLLLATEKKGRYFIGRTFWLYALLYSIARCVIEFYRDHRGRTSLAGLSSGQIISIVVALLAMVMLVRLSRRSAMPESTAELVPAQEAQQSS